MNGETGRVGLTKEGMEAAIESISSPDVVHSPFGELRFFDGVPLPQTVATIYDGLDLIRAVDVFLNCVPGGVDDDPPDPCFERAAAAVAAPLPHGLGEGLLHGVFAKRGITCDRCRGPTELGSLRAVELLEVVDHHPSDAPDEVDSLRL
jgi:hypothetical protein